MANPAGIAERQLTEALAARGRAVSLADIAAGISNAHCQTANAASYNALAIAATCFMPLLRGVRRGWRKTRSLFIE